jgi:alginate O-acetyltransferase complex protein AlgI
MLFNSVDYLVLLTVALVAYWCSPWLRVRQYILFAASAWFYATWSAPFLLMLLFLVAVNWVIGWQLDRDGQRKWLVLGCVVNLGLLAWFKYAKFIAENLAAMLGLLKPGLPAPHLDIILPLGISFYVFELISYLADVYRRRATHERSLLSFALFVLFFPHLIAGPICRVGQFLPQLNALQKLSVRHVYNGSYMFLAGFALKCGIADGIAPFVDRIFAAPPSYAGIDNLLAVVGFGVQILCDFWGYSLMALGAALLFGYALPQNFNAPYAARSIREFWRRWHITLSNWLRDYLYIALGGSRSESAWKVQRNLLLTMLLGGLWHGASWNFVIWGAVHGGALAIHRAYDEARLPAALRSVFRSPPVAWSLTMLVVFVAWIFFRAPHLGDALSMLARIGTPATGWWASRLAPAFFELLLLFLPLQWLVHRTTWMCDTVAQPMRWQIPAVMALTAFSLVYYVDGQQFIYFQF